MEHSYSLTTLDITVIFVYLVAIIWYGLKKGKQSSSEEYFLAGRDATWPIVGISLFAANISSTTIVGLAGSAYGTGISVYNYEWMAVVVLIFFAIFFLPFYLKSQVYTMPEFLERRFDSRSRYYFSFVTLIGNVIIDMAAGLYAGGVILKLVFPDIPSWVIFMGLAFAAAAYTIPGGLNSVIYTEVAQAILLIGCCTILAFIALDKIGGWENALAITPHDKLTLVRPNLTEGRPWYNPDEAVPWLGLIFGVPLLGFYFWGNNQFMVQRMLSSKSLNHGRWGALFAGLLKLPVLYIMVFPGTMARVLYNDHGGLLGNTLSNSNDVYPSMIFDLMPVGLVGLMIAGLMAALTSSISATLNSASTLITMDFVQKIRPNMTSNQLVATGKIATIILVILAAAWAPLIEQFGSIFEYLQQVLSYISPPVVAVFMLGLFWKRTNAHGAFAAFIVGFISLIGAITIMIFNDGEIGVHFLYIAPTLCVLSGIVAVVVSLMTAPPPQEKTEAYVWRRAMFDEETRELSALPWYKNFRYLAVVLLIITAIVIGPYLF